MYIAHHREAKIYKKLRNQNILSFFMELTSKYHPLMDQIFMPIVLLIALMTSACSLILR